MYQCIYMENNKKCFLNGTNQHFLMISKGSSDTEDWGIENSDKYTCKSEAMALKII